VAWRIIDEFASVILRQYEKEMANDVAMKALYNKQHHHDEIAAIKKDPKVEQEEREAAATIQELEVRKQQHKDGVIKGIDAVAVDGSWNTGNASAFEKFDQYLHEHPEETEDHVYHDPNFVDKVQSMLHLHQIEDTVSHAPGDSGAPPAAAEDA